ncbi:MAG: alpha/beta hydrolase [Planctomycetes bacterium]|nr:alpha/beta hydrolase [Planctomycetota bacterium]
MTRGARLVLLVLAAAAFPCGGVPALAAERAPIAPTASDVPYGPSSSHLLDWYSAGTAAPAPVVVFLHGGGGDKSDVATKQEQMLVLLLGNGLTVISIATSPFPQFIYPAQLDDAALATQFIRENAAAFNVDPAQLVHWGTSGGGLVLGLLAYGVDYADPSGPPLEQRSTRPLAYINFQTLTNFFLLVPWYPGTFLGQPTLATVDPLLMAAASVSENVTNVPRSYTPPAFSLYPPSENPPPLTDPHDATMGKDLHARLAAFPAASSQSLMVKKSHEDLQFYEDVVSWTLVRLGRPPHLNLGGALAGTNGVPELSIAGAVTANGTCTLTCRAALSQAITIYLVAGQQNASIPYAGGLMVPYPSGIFALPTDASGVLQIVAPVPSYAVPGNSYYLQFWHPDPAGPAGLAASNGLRVTIEP